MTIVDRGPSVCVDFSAPTAQIVCGVELEMVNTKTVSIKSGEDHRTLAGVGWNEYTRWLNERCSLARL